MSKDEIKLQLIEDLRSYNTKKKVAIDALDQEYQPTLKREHLLALIEQEGDYKDSEGYARIRTAYDRVSYDHNIIEEAENKLLSLLDIAADAEALLRITEVVTLFREAKTVKSIKAGLQFK